MSETDKDARSKQAVATRVRAYRATFDKAQRNVQIVLADLAQFCRAAESTFDTDSHVAAGLAGRREVWLRIAQHLNLQEEEAWALYTGAALRPNVLTALVPTPETEEEDQDG